MSDIEREEFEQAVADKWSDSYKFTRFGDEDYYDEVLEGMWVGWQASREAVESEAVAWLWVVNGHRAVVPKDYADELIEDGETVLPLYTHTASGGKQAVYSLVGHFYNRPSEGRIGIEWCCDSLDDGQELYAKQEQDHE